MSTDNEFGTDEEALWQAFHELPMPEDPPLTFDVARWTKRIVHRSQRRILSYIFLAALMIGGGSWLMLRAFATRPHPSFHMAMANLSGIHMNTATTGWAISNNFQFLYHTSSGGQNWSKVLSLASTRQMPYAFGFPTENSADIIVFNSDQDTVSIDQTQDQGKRWKTTTLPLHPATLSGGALLASTSRQFLGLGVSSGHSQTVELFDYINGLAAWHQIPYTPGFYNLDALSSGPHGSLWAVAQPSPGQKFSVFQSHDGGKHWIAVNLPPLPVKTSALMPLEPKFFGNGGLLPVMVTVSSTPPAFSDAQVWLYRTQDGGKHWFPWTHYQSMLANLQAGYL